MSGGVGTVGPPLPRFFFFVGELGPGRDADVADRVDGPHLERVLAVLDAPDAVRRPAGGERGAVDVALVAHPGLIRGELELGSGAAGLRLPLRRPSCRPSSLGFLVMRAVGAVVSILNVADAGVGSMLPDGSRRRDLEGVGAVGEVVGGGERRGAAGELDLVKAALEGRSGLVGAEGEGGALDLDQRRGSRVEGGFGWGVVDRAGLLDVGDRARTGGLGVDGVDGLGADIGRTPIGHRDGDSRAFELGLGPGRVGGAVTAGVLEDQYGRRCRRRCCPPPRGCCHWPGEAGLVVRARGRDGNGGVLVVGDRGRAGSQVVQGVEAACADLRGGVVADRDRDAGPLELRLGAGRERAAAVAGLVDADVGRARCGCALDLGAVVVGGRDRDGREARGSRRAGRVLLVGDRGRAGSQVVQGVEAACADLRGGVVADRDRDAGPLELRLGAGRERAAAVAGLVDADVGRARCGCALDLGAVVVGRGDRNGGDARGSRRAGRVLLVGDRGSSRFPGCPGRRGRVR